MKLPQLKSHFFNSLSELYAKEELQSFFYLLMEQYGKMSRLELALHPEKTISRELAEKYDAAVQRLREFEPIQYILGETEFFGITLAVNSHTLIPRPETEELVDWVLQQTEEALSVDILDIGTGSGCIAIALAKNLPHAQVSALDYSEKTLKTAKQNAERNSVAIEFFKTDILKTKTLPQQYDIIISNPPYVRNMEKVAMNPNVLYHEPEAALFVSDSDPLLFYRKILDLAKRYLKPGGKIFFEINEYLAPQTEALLNDSEFYNVVVKQDIFGKNRMISGTITK